MRVWIASGFVTLLSGCTTFVGEDTTGEETSSGAETDADTSSGAQGSTGTSGASGAEAGTTDDPDPTADPTVQTTDPTTTTDTTSTTAAETTRGAETSSSGESSSTGGPPPETCGDGEPQGEELCDDGNANELDGCTSACIPGPTAIDFGATFETELIGGGSTTGIQNATENCPPNEVLVGLDGDISMEGWLGVIGGQCRNADLTNADPPLFVTNGPLTELPEHGGYQAGGPWQTQCPEDQAIVAVQGGAGDVMDGLQIRCADVQTAGDPGAHTLDPVPSAWEPLQGGSGGSSFGPLECPAGSVATGLQTETNSYVVRIRLLCRAITLAYP